MSFDDLPNEIIGRILCCLMDDPESFVRLSSSCKRFNQVAKQVTSSKEWIQRRPLAFNLYLEYHQYAPDLCNAHGFCTEQQLRNGWSCELEAFTKAIQKNRGSHNDNRDKPINSSPTPTGRQREDGDLIENEDDEAIRSKFRCYYHRLYCLLNTKYRCFSSIKFKEALLSDRGCMRAFSDSLVINGTLAEHRLHALVELELYDCYILLDWLNTILNELKHVQYLSLNQNRFLDDPILVEPRFQASKALKQLKIVGDRSINDSIFMYFLENFPAHELDLTATKVEYHKRIIQRFYTNITTDDTYSSCPSEYIFTFPLVLLYLKKYQAVVRHFIADETNITFSSLKRILQDGDLKYLKVTIKNCPMITHFERARLAEQIDESDLTRVTF